MMNATTRRGFSPWLVLLAMLIMGVVGADMLQAQTFYGLYGDHDKYQERGFKRVIPVLNQTCSITDSITRTSDGECRVLAENIQTNGYIAVGFSDMPRQGNDRDVYVVRTNNEGRTVWEKTYDIGFNRLNDSAWSVVEMRTSNNCRGCFAIVGTAEFRRTNGLIDTDIFLLIIDNNGNVVSLTVYDINNVNQYGRDIIQTRFPFPNSTPPVPGYQLRPQAGDLVFCGWTSRGGQFGTEDGVIIRTDCNGQRVWEVEHDLLPGPPPNVSDEVYLAVTESLNNQATARNGDILVAGIQTARTLPINVQGLIGRVQGADGRSAGAGLGTGFANFGRAGVEQFHSIIELSDPAGTTGLAGGVVAVGQTTSANTLGVNDVYSVLLPGGYPCRPGFRNLVVADPGINISDRGRDVREVQSAGLGFAAQGDLIITGNTNTFGGDDIFLLPIRMPLFTPPGFWFLYGDFGTRNDQAHSLADVAALQGRTRGVIMCGWSNSDPCGIGGSTDDLFLVKTNAAGRVADAATGDECYKVQDILRATPNWPNSCLDSLWRRPFNVLHAEYLEECWDTDIICCYTPSTSITPDATPGSKLRNEAAPGAEEDLSGSMIHTRPNPVKGGEVLNLTVAPPEPATIMVTVTNMRGEEIFRRELPEVKGGTDVPISTDGWPSGAYLLKASDGHRIDAMRINVFD